MSLKLFREPGVQTDMMKKLLFALFAFATVVLFASDSRSEIARKLYGEIRVVDIGEDYTVRRVDIGEDLRVRVVDIGADQPGEWQFVDIGEDISVRFVDIGEGFD